MPQPKRGSLPFLFLLSLAAIFLFSFHYHSSIPLSHPKNAILSPLTPHSLTPTPHKFTFTVKLLTFNRLNSLSRCLRSLAAADYAADRVHLHIFVDHFRDIDPVNGSALIDSNLEESQRILQFIDGFDWRQGEKMVHYRTGNVGLQAQWLEAWWPASDDEFAFVVEDDVEVSPLYYRFLKGLIMRYYYDGANYSPAIYGASLQRPRFVSGKHGNKLQVDDEIRLFLYQMVGTWGQLLFPKPWKEFRLWYNEHKAKGIKPFLQGMVSTGWYKKMGERIWTPWFIKFVHHRGYYNIYTNFPHEGALSISHRDAGVNYGKSAGPDSNLLDRGSVNLNHWEAQPPLINLRWYDFCFREVFPSRILRNYDDLGYFLDSVQKQKTVMFLSLYRTPERIVRNLLCHLERLGLKNAVFLGGSIELLLDLARRGYSVIDSTGLQSSGENLVKEIQIKARVVRKCLELGFHSWVIECGNVIPISASFTELADPAYSFFAASDVELMLVRSSPAALKVWGDDFISKLAAEAGKSISVGPGHFAYYATKALGEIPGVRVVTLDEMSLGVKISDVVANRTSIERGRRMVFWSREIALDSIQRELESLGLWLIDGDSSCLAVICNPEYAPR